MSAEAYGHCLVVLCHTLPYLMCACGTYRITAELSLGCILGGSPLVIDIVKDQHHFVVEERGSSIVNDIRLADFNLVFAVIVDGLTLSAYPHVLVAVFRSCQFTNPVAESLVAEFVGSRLWSAGKGAKRLRKR
ncbi:hypothetical protein NXW75_17025 [Bacteroides xylanisolvens]|nr:hypothetical protein [Bacteroides xylanisolvens]